MLNVSRSFLINGLKLKNPFTGLPCTSILAIFLLLLVVDRSTVTHANVQSTPVQPTNSNQNYSSPRNANYSIDVTLDPKIAR